MSNLEQGAIGLRLHIGVLLLICGVSSACRTAVPGEEPASDSYPSGYESIDDVWQPSFDEVALSELPYQFEIAPRDEDPFVGSEYDVDFYDPDRSCNGLTLLGDNADPDNPRIVEVGMQGEVIWEYYVPDDLKVYTNPGFDVERLKSGGILATFPGKGVYEITREGEIGWFYENDKLSHDADRLSDGNTLMAFGQQDTPMDAQGTEIAAVEDEDGTVVDYEVVWEWFATDNFDPFDVGAGYGTMVGWTHTNAVSRLSDGRTMVSPRNFDLVLILETIDGENIVDAVIGDGLIHDAHDPEYQSDGFVLLANYYEGESEVLEIHSQTGEIRWNFNEESSPSEGEMLVRDANRLENGNTLIVATTMILEVTDERDLVWRIKAPAFDWTPKTAEGARQGFYKAERACAPRD